MNTHQKGITYTAEMYRKDFLTCKSDIQKDVKDRLEFIMNKALSDNNHSMAYYMNFKNLIERFLDKLEETVLFQNLEDWWSYDVSVGHNGIVLYLEKSDFNGLTDEGEPMLIPRQYFRLIYEKAKLMSVEEYAAMQDVSVGTVRQWIRRGKIREAVKFGNEWRIPELTEKPTRGYTSATYHWSEELIGLPEEFHFLNKYDGVTITQNKEDKSVYSVALQSECDGNTYTDKVIQCPLKTKERLELLCISHPQIRYIPNLTDIFWDWSVYKF